MCVLHDVIAQKKTTRLRMLLILHPPNFGFTTDGIKAVSHGFSGGKQVIKFVNARNRGRVFFSSKQQKMKNFLP